LRASRVFGEVLGGHDMIVEDVDLATEIVATRGEADREVAVLITSVRPYARDAGRCSRCLPGYDGGAGVRRWWALDVGTTKTYLQAPAPRVACTEYGVVVAAVPWARAGAKCTYALEEHLRVVGRAHRVERAGGIAATVLADGVRDRGPRRDRQCRQGRPVSRSGDFHMSAISGVSGSMRSPTAKATGT
jgi:transposase